MDANSYASRTNTDPTVLADAGESGATRHESDPGERGVLLTGISNRGIEPRTHPPSADDDNVRHGRPHLQVAVDGRLLERP